MSVLFYGTRLMISVYSPFYKSVKPKIKSIHIKGIGFANHPEHVKLTPVEETENLEPNTSPTQSVEPKHKQPTQIRPPAQVKPPTKKSSKPSVTKLSTVSGSPFEKEVEQKPVSKGPNLGTQEELVDIENSGGLGTKETEVESEEKLIPKVPIDDEGNIDFDDLHKLSDSLGLNFEDVERVYSDNSTEEEAIVSLQEFLDQIQLERQTNEQSGELNKSERGDDGGIEHIRPDRPDQVETGKERRDSNPVFTSRSEITSPANTNLVPESHRKVLNPEQIEGVGKGVEALEKYNRFNLFDSPGAGKTDQEVSIGKVFLDKGMKVLYITMGGVLKADWVKETFNFEALQSAADRLGAKLKIAMDSIEEGVINLSTYDRLKNLKDLVDKNTLLIFDECHQISIETAQRSQYAMEMIDKAGKRFFASATPIDAAFHVGYLIRNSGDYGNKSVAEVFTSWGMVKKGNRWECPTEEVEKRVAKEIVALSDRNTERGIQIQRGLSLKNVDIRIIRLELYKEQLDRLKNIELKKMDSGVAEWTEKINENNIQLQVIEKQKREKEKEHKEAEYKRVNIIRQIAAKEIDPNLGTRKKDELIHQVKESKSQISILESKVQELREEGKRLEEERKRASRVKGNKGDVEMSQRRILEEMKIPEALAIAKRELEEKRQLIIFASRVNGTVVTARGRVIDKAEATMEELKKGLLEIGVLAEEIGEVHSELTKKHQYEIIQKFQKGILKVLIGTIESSGTGIDLDDQIGDHPRSMILITPPWKGTHIIQAVGRVHRKYTKSDPRIYYMFSDAKIDDKNIGILVKKIRTSGGFVDPRFLKYIEFAKPQIELTKSLRHIKGFRVPPSPFIPLLRNKGSLVNSTSNTQFSKHKSVDEFEIKKLEEKHDYGCLMVKIPDDLRKQITDWVIENIPDYHLGPGGRELNPHVTLKYGFHDGSDETLETIKMILSKYGSISIKFGKLSLFKSGSGKLKNEDGDVLKLEVESPKLHEIYEEISESIPCEDKFYPNYRPHITLAYLDPKYSSLYAEEDLSQEHNKALPKYPKESMFEDPTGTVHPPAKPAEQAISTPKSEPKLASSVPHGQLPSQRRQYVPPETKQPKKLKVESPRINTVGKSPFESGDSNLQERVRKVNNISQPLQLELPIRPNGDLDSEELWNLSNRERKVITSVLGTWGLVAANKVYNKIAKGTYKFRKSEYRLPKNNEIYNFLLSMATNGKSEYRDINIPLEGYPDGILGLLEDNELIDYKFPNETDPPYYYLTASGFDNLFNQKEHSSSVNQLYEAWKLGEDNAFALHDALLEEGNVELAEAIPGNKDQKSLFWSRKAIEENPKPSITPQSKPQNIQALPEPLPESVQAPKSNKLRPLTKVSESPFEAPTLEQKPVVSNDLKKEQLPVKTQSQNLGQEIEKLPVVEPPQSEYIKQEGQNPQEGNLPNTELEYNVDEDGDYPVEVGHFTAFDLYHLPKNAKELSKDKDWKYGWDVLTAAAGLRPAAFTDLVEGREAIEDPKAANKANMLFQKYELNAVAIQGNEGIIVVSNDHLHDPNLNKFLELANRYQEGAVNLEDFTPEEHRLLGKWLGYPKESTDEYLTPSKIDENKEDPSRKPHPKNKGELRDDVVKLINLEGKTPAEIAEILGINQTTIRNVIRNHRNLIDTSMLEKIREKDRNNQTISVGGKTVPIGSKYVISDLMKQRISQTVNLINAGKLSTPEIAKILGISKQNVNYIISKFTHLIDPEALKNVRAAGKKIVLEAAAAGHKTPKYREKVSKIVSARWKDPEFRKLGLEFLEKARVASQRNWEDPEFKKKMVNLVKEEWKRRGGFWNWITTFPTEKAEKIVYALVSGQFKGKEDNREKMEKLQAMLYTLHESFREKSHSNS